MEPKLALTYSSRGGASAYGHGWAVSGLSLIQRGPRNLQDDGEVAGVRLTATDALFLDGEKLVEVASGDASYREYRTRIDSISRVRAYGVGPDGPDRLVVETRAGLMMTYGTRVRLKSGQTISWLCDRITDRAGNYMTFHYVFDVEGGQPGLEHYIDRVAYTGNVRAGLAPYAELKFNYVDVAPYGSRYVFGQPTVQRKLLQSIVSSYRGQVLRSYRPSYIGPTPTQFYHVMQSLTEEGARGTSFKPIKFDYTVANPHWAPRSLMSGIERLPDLGGVSAGLASAYRYLDGGSNGRPLVMVAATAAGKTLRETFEFDPGPKRWEKVGTPPAVIFGGDEGAAPSVAVADVNGDGRQDLVSSAGPYGNVEGIHINNGGGAWASHAVAPPVPIQGRSLRSSGLLEIDVLEGGQVKKGFVWDFRLPGQGRRRGAAVWTGSGWRALSDFRPPHPLGKDDVALSGAFAMDVDCDGARELVYLQRLSGGGARAEIHKASAQGWREVTDPKFRLPIDAPPADAALRFVDMDKDGCRDLVVSYKTATTSVSAIHLAKASGWKTDARPLPQAWFWTPDLPAGATLAELADLNGDGESDFFQAANGQRTAWRGHGSDWRTDDELRPPGDLPQSSVDRAEAIRIISLDGDSQPEWLDLSAPDEALVPAVYTFLPANGWRRDRDYSVPIDISAYDKVDLGVRFIDLNGDGYQDLVWARQRTDGALDRAAYVFTPNAGEAWRKDDRYILPEALVNEDYKDAGVLLADVNGDGLVDIVVGRRTGGANRLETYLNCSRDGACKSRPQTDASAFWKVASKDPATAGLVPPEVFVEDGVGSHGAQLIDMNGDGLTDIVLSRTVEKWSPTSPEERQQTGQRQKPSYELYSRTWLNAEGRRWVETPSYRLPVPLVRPIVRDRYGQGDAEGFPGVTVKETRAQLFDLNNDRLPDVIWNYEAFEQQLGPGNIYAPVAEVRVGARVRGPAGWADAAGYAPPRRLDEDKSAEKRQVHYSDLNGDGLVDLAYAEGAQSETRLNTGLGWSSAHPGYRLPAEVIRDSKGDQGFRFIDVNGDLLADIVYSWTTSDPQAPKKGVRLNTGVNWSAADAPAALAPPLPFAEHERGDNGVRSVDLNGDGLPDLVQAYKRSDNQVDRLVYVNETDPPYLLLAITDGLGFSSRLTHRSFLAYQYPEERGKVAPPPPVRSSPAQERASVYPYIHAPLPGHLVTQLVTGGPGVPARTIRYKYDGYRVDVLSGRSLGFEEQVTTDVDRDRSTFVRYLQEEGYLGAPALLQVRQGPAIISETATSYDLAVEAGLARALPQGGSFTPRIYRRMVQTTRSESRDLAGVLLNQQDDSFRYDAFSNPIRIETRFGDGSRTVTENRFDDALTTWTFGRLVEASVVLSSPGQASITKHSTFTYDAATGLISSETANARTSLAVTTHYERDLFGNKIGLSVSASGVRTPRGESFEADPEGRFVIGATNAVGLRTSTTYDPVSGAVLTRTDTNNLVLRYTYDDLQRQLSEVAPNGVVTSVSTSFASPAPEVVAVTTRRTAGLPPVRMEMDAAGRVHRLRETGWGGRPIVTETVYDQLGRTVATSVPRFQGEPARYHRTFFDALDRVVREVRPDGATALASYEGLTVRRTNSKGSQSVAVSDLRGRVIRTTDAIGGITSFEYDAAGRTAAITNALGHVSRQEYDAAGRRIALRDPTLGVWTYTYTVFGELESQTDPRGKTVRMAYDDIGRMVSRTAGVQTARWSYDTAPNGKGRLAEAVSGERRRRTFKYDQLSRLAQLRSTIGRDTVTTTFQYDTLGRVVGSAYSTGVSVTNRYDEGGFWREVSLSDNGEGTTVYTLGAVDAAGRVTAEATGNGVRSSHTYDDASARLLRTQSRNAQGAFIQDLALSYDLLGNVVAMADGATGRTSTYSYDELSRLTSVAGNREPSVRVSYDALGNILTKGGAVYRYCEQNGRPGLLCAVEAGGKVTELRYDQAANVVAYGERELVFDEQGRVSSITAAQMGSVRATYSDFTYGADGEMETQRSRHDAIRYDVSYFGDVEVVRENFTPPHMPTTERTRVRHYIAGPSGVIGFYEKLSLHFPLRSAAPTYGALTTEKPERVTRLLSGFVYFTKDHLGSLRALTDGSGKVVQRYEFDPWGKRLSDKGYRYHTVRQGFTGHEMLDHLGLIHMGGRVYSPDLARFLSPDPFLQSPGFSQSHNRYSYVLNNPLNIIDPSGYWGIKLPSLGDVVGGLGRALGGIVDATIGKPLAWVGEQLAKGGRWLQQNWRVVVIVAATVALGPAGTMAGAMLTGAAIGGFSALLYGGSFEDVLRGAAIGAITGGAFHAAGSIAMHYKLGTVGAASVHGVVGGAASVMQGGRFESGFLSSFVTRSLGSQINQGATAGERVARAAIVGGVASQVGGGSFENGAITSAFAQMYNEESHGTRMREYIKAKGAARLNTDFERNLFDRWWGGETSFGLTEAEFKELVAYLEANPDKVRATSDPKKFSVSFYNSDKYDYAIGSATMFKDDAGNWVRLQDDYDFDWKWDGSRSPEAERATRAVSIADYFFGSSQGATAICYPPSACGAPSREPPQQRMTPMHPPKPILGLPLH